MASISYSGYVFIVNRFSKTVLLPDQQTYERRIMSVHKRSFFRLKQKYEMKVLNFYLGFLLGVRLRGRQRNDRELTTLFDVTDENRLLSEAAINQMLHLDLFQGDIIRNTKPSPRNIQKDLTKRWPK